MRGLFDCLQFKHPNLLLLRAEIHLLHVPFDVLQKLHLPVVLHFVFVRVTRFGAVQLACVLLVEVGLDLLPVVLDMVEPGWRTPAGARSVCRLKVELRGIVPFPGMGSVLDHLV